MKVAYADPPYVGMCSRYQHNHPDGLCWDNIETTRLLIERLNLDYPDGWALSCKSDATELAQLIAWAEADGKKARIGSWVKTFHIYRPNVNPSYGWEPVIFKGGGRKRGRYEATVRDFHSERITMKKGLTGAKPPGFNAWILQLLGAQPGDQVDDLFPGTGGMAEAIKTLPAPVLTTGRPRKIKGGQGMTTPVCPVHLGKKIDLIPGSTINGIRDPPMLVCVACMEDGASPLGAWSWELPE